MSIHTTCPECGARITFSDTPAGKKIRCGKCQAVFDPSPRRGEGPTEEGPRSSRSPARPNVTPAPVSRKAGGAGTSRRRDDEDEDRPARRRQKEVPTGIPLAWLIGGPLVVLLLIGGVIGLVIWLGHRSVEQPDVASRPPVNAPVIQPPTACASPLVRPKLKGSSSSSPGDPAPADAPAPAPAKKTATHTASH